MCAPGRTAGSHRAAPSERLTAIEIRIPKLGMEMTEATLSSWLAEDGATVSQDEPVYLLETDKVENEIAAPIGGILRHIGSEGETYPVGEVIATID